VISIVVGCFPVSSLPRIKYPKVTQKTATLPTPAPKQDRFILRKRARKSPLCLVRSLTVEIWNVHAVQFAPCCATANQCTHSTKRGNRGKRHFESKYARCEKLVTWQVTCRVLSLFEKTDPSPRAGTAK